DGHVTGVQTCALPISLWAGLPPQQQEALKDEFRRYTIATYVSNFDGFSGQRFEIQPGSTAAGADQIVQTRIVPASGDAHRLDYRSEERRVGKEGRPP